jgi:beta-1,4-mannosyl-glycoprotein beta-1,4-N-acetylglucosaminyltransferase
MKIIDCFLFYNEIDLLNYRLNILNEVVDYFVIVESKYTFSGKEKKLYLEENKHLFEKFKDKIIHLIVNDIPYTYPTIDYSKNEQWQNEFHQRNMIQYALNKMSLNNEDAILISDVDEIIDPNFLKKIKNREILFDFHSLGLDFYYYNLNSKKMEEWRDYAKIISYQLFQELKLSCSKIRNSYRPVLEKAGWHLSYFGDSKFIKNKIETFSHQEFNQESFTDIKKINERIENGKDLFDRNENTIIHIPISENDYLPVAYETYLTKFYT